MLGFGGTRWERPLDYMRSCIHRMIRAQRRLFTGVALMAAMTAVPAAAQQQRAPTPQEVEEAQKRWKEGKAAYDRGDFEKALLAFKQAWATYPHAAFLQNVGEAEARAGRYLVDPSSS
jgi:hypothetical protein